MALLVYTIIEAPDHGWASAAHARRLRAGGGPAAAFIAGTAHAEPMLDLRLFHDPRFSAASASVTVSFFTLFGFIFLITQYFQFLKDYGPLSTGVHLLPVAISVAVASILGTRLAVRIGTKLDRRSRAVLDGRLLLLGRHRHPPTTSYVTIAAQMVVLGTGWA